MSRGARSNRRITTNSTAEPSATATTSATGTATQYDQPWRTTSDTQSAAGTAPRSAWAKLMTRCDRYTSTRPNASSAISELSTSPQTTIPNGVGQSNWSAT